MAALAPEALEALTKLGNGDPTAGFRQLCAMAFTCSVCGQRWGTDSRCGCPGSAPKNRETR